MSKPVLEMRKISKSYSGVKVLKEVDFVLNEGEILGLVGENGAGKSTLMKILSGGTQPDEGQILLDGQEIEITNPIVAQHLKIAMVQQELSLISSLTVTDNIVFGQEKKLGPLRMLDKKANQKYAQKALDMVNLSLPLEAVVGKLSVANQQMLEISRNLVREPRVLILDEPTTALTLVEAAALLEQMLALKILGTSIIFISHKLEEIMQVCDRMVILRDGAKAGEAKKDEITRQDLIRLMVGDKQFFQRTAMSRQEIAKKELLLEAKNLSREKVFSNISFQLHRGEVLGFFGLKGAGRSDLFLSIFGAENIDQGELSLEGKPVKFGHTWEAISAGVGLVSEDRKFSGIFPNMNIKDNILMSDLRSVSTKTGVVNEKAVGQVCDTFVEKLGIKIASKDQHIKRLSGGNQQKVMISRWLHTKSKVLILDEPTKGVDVGAKQDIYQQIQIFTEEGKGIVVISSELEEVMLLSDRVAVMREGKIEAILEGDDMKADIIMHHAAG